MKSSCVNHPTKERLIMIRAWQVEACGGNHCAAALLSFFEYWHNIRLESSEKARQSNEISERHGEDGKQDASLYQFHTAAQLSEGLCGLYGEDTIRKALAALVKLEFISISKNPNPRYAFDATKYFLFHSENVNNYLNERYPKNPTSYPKNQEREPKNQERSPENREAIHEITTETTSKKVSYGYGAKEKTSRRAPSENDLANFTRRDNLIQYLKQKLGTDKLPDLKKQKHFALELVKSYSEADCITELEREWNEDWRDKPDWATVHSNIAYQHARNPVVRLRKDSDALRAELHTLLGCAECGEVPGYLNGGAQPCGCNPMSKNHPRYSDYKKLNQMIRELQRAEQGQNKKTIRDYAAVS